MLVLNKGGFMAKKNTREKDIETAIRKYIEFDLHAYVIKIHGSAFQEPGIPDLLACINGWFVGIEVKNEVGVVSEVQKIHISNIKKAGGIAIVTRSLEDTIEQLTALRII